MRRRPEAGGMDSSVLVLNQNYEPLNICDLRRALCLVFLGKADILVPNHRLIRSPSQEVECPSVIRLRYTVHRPPPQVRLTRREVFRRDGYICQYCGQQAPDVGPRGSPSPRGKALLGEPGDGVYPLQPS
jgi:hypothetical protein